jgi:hypothetical protein
LPIPASPDSTASPDRASPSRPARAASRSSSPARPISGAMGPS